LRRLGGGYLSIHNLVDNGMEVRHQREHSRRRRSDRNRRWQAGDERLVTGTDVPSRLPAPITSRAAELWISPDIHSGDPGKEPAAPRRANNTFVILADRHLRTRDRPARTTEDQPAASTSTWTVATTS
jgi:hypothetical protein